MQGRHEQSSDGEERYQPVATLLLLSATVHVQYVQHVQYHHNTRLEVAGRWRLKRDKPSMQQLQVHKPDRHLVFFPMNLT